MRSALSPLSASPAAHTRGYPKHTSSESAPLWRPRGRLSSPAIHTSRGTSARTKASRCFAREAQPSAAARPAQIMGIARFASVSRPQLAPRETVAWFSPSTWSRTGSGVTAPTLVSQIADRSRQASAHGLLGDSRRGRAPLGDGCARPADRRLRLGAQARHGRDHSDTYVYVDSHGCEHSDHKDRLGFRR
jgi:hypothetical protein